MAPLNSQPFKVYRVWLKDPFFVGNGANTLAHTSSFCMYRVLRNVLQRFHSVAVACIDAAAGAAGVIVRVMIPKGAKLLLPFTGIKALHLFGIDGLGDKLCCSLSLSLFLYTLSCDVVRTIVE